MRPEPSEARSPAARHVPELADLPPARVHTPWSLDPATHRRLGYPDPLVELS